MKQVIVNDRFVKNLKGKVFSKNNIFEIAIILAVLFIVGKFLLCSMKESFNQKTFDQIASLLVVYDAKEGGNSLEFIRIGRENDGGYVVPFVALKKSDCLMGYGIADDISFERDYSQRFNKHSFGFDCGVQNIETGDNRCHFYSECIGNSNCLYGDQKSSEQIASFSEQLHRLNLANKKVFVKMDIEGAEFDVMDDILNHERNITGMVLEIHIPRDDPKKALELMSAVNRYFVLIHLHGNNYSGDYFKTKHSMNAIPTVLELTYINKNIIDSYEISKNQKCPRSLDQRNSTNIPECEFEILP